MVIAMRSLAYTLATYALPFFFAIMATPFAFATGAGYIGAGIVGLFAGVGVFTVSLPISMRRCARRDCLSPSP
ncbi:hypothetical protein D3C86_2223600 [compost metagenome]